MDGGKVTIKDHGLFLIYAQVKTIEMWEIIAKCYKLLLSQVFYSDVFDTNGFSIEQNDVSKLQCVTTIHSETRVHKINTCSTSGLVYLNYGDKIWIKGKYLKLTQVRIFFLIFYFVLKILATTDMVNNVIFFIKFLGTLIVLFRCSFVGAIEEFLWVDQNQSTASTDS